jgi:hypothetical protein
VSVLALAIAVSVVLTIPKDRPEGLQAFLTILIFPAVAPALAGFRGPAWPFFAGALYAALAALQQTLAADGQITLIDQLSTAALVSLSCGAILQLAALLGRFTARKIERT